MPYIRALGPPSWCCCGIPKIGTCCYPPGRKLVCGYIAIRGKGWYGASSIGRSRFWGKLCS